MDARPKKWCDVLVDRKNANSLRIGFIAKHTTWRGSGQLIPIGECSIPAYERMDDVSNYGHVSDKRYGDS